MPRPGPRPYECVRRAWHSDRHQPMRGSLIQEIFRVVNEIHSSATRKNKEWQNKLPIVVLKAEEIMYSKANCEAEYMDLETLWDRVNDAINTIIRLDESIETGVFLQPCIEAALNLGCTPRRTSRGERNNTSAYYLNINTTNPNCFPSNNLHKSTQEAPMTINPFVNIKNPNDINLVPFKLKSLIPFLKNDNSLEKKLPFPNQPNGKGDPCQNTKAPLVYPLYYGKDIQIKGQKCNFDAPSKPHCNLNENRDTGFVQNLSFLNPKSKNDEIRADLAYKSEEKSFGLECDLSLRLGPSSTTQNVREFDNFTNSLLGKRKAVVSTSPEDLRHCWHSKLSSSNFNGGRMKNAGL